MKIDICDVCLANNKLTKTKIKGQTCISGNRLGLCRSKKCHAVWKKINSDQAGIRKLQLKGYENIEVLLK